MKIKQELTQTTKVTQEVVIRNLVLEMNNQELSQYITDIIVDNPLISADEVPPLERNFCKFLTENQYITEGDRQNSRYYSDDASSFIENLSGDSTEYAPDDSLADVVFPQIESLRINGREKAHLKFIIKNLDDNGYFSEDLEAFSKQLKISVDQLENYLRIIKGLTPFGLGAANLKECLLIQLQKTCCNEPVIATAIISNYLDLLGKNHLTKIAALLNVDLERVEAAKQDILSLNPRPGYNYNPKQSSVHYIYPDVFVVDNNGTFDIVLNEEALPSLTLNQGLLSQLANDDSAETKEYIREKIEQYKKVTRSIENRNNNLTMIVKRILEIQSIYFRTGDNNLLPLRMGEIAKQLGISESTVSRTAKNKYLQCKYGVVPLSFFFSNGFRSNQSVISLSKKDIIKMVKSVIFAESPDKPLSDENISKILETKGINVSRRTVAKIRQENGIPDCRNRKQRNN